MWLARIDTCLMAIITNDWEFEYRQLSLVSLQTVLESLLKMTKWKFLILELLHNNWCLHFLIRNFIVYKNVSKMNAYAIIPNIYFLSGDTSICSCNWNTCITQGKLKILNLNLLNVSKRKNRRSEIKIRSNS